MKARDLALVSIYTAMLIGGQLIFSWIAGIEIVTVLLVAFCYSFGAKRSLVLVNAFLWLHCIIFGFFPTVVILYIVYYNLFAIFLLLSGKCVNNELQCLIIITVALLFPLLEKLLVQTFKIK